MVERVDGVCLNQLNEILGGARSQMQRNSITELKLSKTDPRDRTIRILRGNGMGGRISSYHLDVGRMTKCITVIRIE